MRNLYISAVIIGLFVVGGGFLFIRGNTTQTMTPTPTPSLGSESNGSTAASADSDKVSGTQSAEAAMSKGETKTFTVTGQNFSFSPGEIKVKKGDTVKITFKNVGGFHNFVLDEFNVKTEQIGNGESADVSFVADREGTFEYYCGVGNHRQMGMVGKLIVE